MEQFSSGHLKKIDFNENFMMMKKLEKVFFKNRKISSF
jgi:hypothetical protein